jgi:GTP-binding protein LepA
MAEPSQIRNFCIIAHIDHGKTTLSDRVLELTGALTQREMSAQVLDDMDLERERGITIKARAVALDYKSDDGQTYRLNLIDTPGHVDFTYEVSRSLAACEGAVLVVDATQGVEAQTLANAYLAVNGGLEILPVINKIDLPSAEPERVKEQIEQVVGVDASEAPLVSAKAGIGVHEMLETLVHTFHPPKGNAEGPLRALLFDAWYDPYRGVTMLVRVVDGEIRPGSKVRMMATGRDYNIESLGIFTPKPKPVTSLGVGEVGWLTAGLRELRQTKIGDTLTEALRPATEALPGFEQVKPMVYAGLFPVVSEDYENLRDAVEKLTLNDASFTFEPDNSEALGFGFRCGYLGLLHMEIIQERLEREFSLNLITTVPGVRYRVTKTDGVVEEIENPAKLPAPNYIEAWEEPYIEGTIITRDDSVGAILALSEERRGIQKTLEYLTPTRVMIRYEFPLAEVILDFYDKLKSASKGYASFDYHLVGWRRGELVKLEVLVNGEAVDALSMIVHSANAHRRGKAITEKMKEIIPRQMYEVAIQAAIGSKIVARSTVKALRKDVLAKCYGGDISRKRKLLEKQKEGKRRMKKVGRIEIPQEAFLAVLKVDS